MTTRSRTVEQASSTTTWTCRACAEAAAGCNLPADLNAWIDPPHPDSTCESCGEHAPEATRTRILLRMKGVETDRTQVPAAVEASKLYSVSAAARLLHVDRRATLGPAIEAGAIRAVQAGDRKKISGAEILRYSQEGQADAARSRRLRAMPARRSNRAGSAGIASIHEIPL